MVSLDPLHQAQSHPNVTFFAEPEERQFTFSGGKADLKNGVEITVPPHSIPVGSAIKIKVQPSFAPSDVFVMPEGVQSASPAYFISCEGSTNLDCGVTVTMEHHVRVSTSEEAANLVFLQADPLPKQSDSGSSVYEYHEVSDGVSEFTSGKSNGKLTVKSLLRKFFKVGFRVIVSESGGRPRTPLFTCLWVL